MSRRITGEEESMRAQAVVFKSHVAWIHGLEMQLARTKNGLSSGR